MGIKYRSRNRSPTDNAKCKEVEEGGGRRWFPPQTIVHRRPANHPSPPFAFFSPLTKMVSGTDDRQLRSVQLKHVYYNKNKSNVRALKEEERFWLLIFHRNLR